MTSDRPRVLLINPPPWKVVEPWYDAPAFPRHGLACLAGYLSRTNEFEIRVIDAKLERLDFHSLVQQATLFRPNIAALTAFTNEVKPAAHVASLLKAPIPEVKTIIGASTLPRFQRRHSTSSPSFDFGCHGEGRSRSSISAGPFETMARWNRSLVLFFETDFSPSKHLTEIGFSISMPCHIPRIAFSLRRPRESLPIFCHDPTRVSVSMQLLYESQRPRSEAALDRQRHGGAEPSPDGLSRERNPLRR
jgi:hypothetical protein